MFLQLVALSIVHYNNDVKLVTKRFTLSLLPWSIATLFRSTGSFSAIIPMFYTLHKLIRNWFYLQKPGTVKKTACYSRCQYFDKGVKYLFFILFVPCVIGLVPVLMVTVWKPYEMYCLSRLDTMEEVPSWCWESFPNLYKHIQKEFWQVGFGEFLRRPWYLTATSLFTNQLLFYIIYRQIKGLGIIDFLSLGLFKTVSTHSNNGETDAFSNLTMFPHFLVFVINLIIVMLFANSEINARVASTCPFYFIALSQLVIETFNEIHDKGFEKLTYKHWVVMLTLLYNSVVMVLNLVLFSVEIGFI